MSDTDDTVTDKALAAAFQLLAEACPLETIPWVNRLVRDVVDSTLQIAREES